MSLCVTVNPDGTLTDTATPVESCAGYVLVDASEHAQMSFLASLFEWPEAEIAGTWLVGAFGFVIACNVVGAVVGSVVKAVSTERD